MCRERLDDGDDSGWRSTGGRETSTDAALSEFDATRPVTLITCGSLSEALAMLKLFIIHDFKLQAEVVDSFHTPLKLAKDQTYLVCTTFPGPPL